MSDSFPTELYDLNFLIVSLLDGPKLDPDFTKRDYNKDEEAFSPNSSTRAIRQTCRYLHCVVER